MSTYEEAAAFKATFHNYKFVLGRKVMQVILEVPLEDSQRVQTILGAPHPGAEQWVGCARLNNDDTNE